VPGSSSGQVLKFHLEGQPKLRLSNPPKQETQRILYGFFPPQKYFKTSWRDWPAEKGEIRNPNENKTEKTPTPRRSRRGGGRFSTDA